MKTEYVEDMGKTNRGVEEEFLSSCSTEKEDFNGVGGSSNKDNMTEDEYIVIKAEMEDYHDDSTFQLQQWGMPSNFGTNSKRSCKKRKSTQYFCNLCQVDLTSDCSRESHIKGMNHLKRRRIENQKKNDAGCFATSKVGIAEAGKKKVPIRLVQKIRESTEPVIGLESVYEYIAESNDEVEPVYQCKLCGNKGIANAMLAHVVGRKHRQNVLQSRDPHNVALITLALGELRDYACDNRENDQAENLIETIRSDETFPWNVENNPYSLENGGTNVPPVGAIKNFGISKPSDFQPNFDIRRNELLPHPSEITTPTTPEEKEGLIQLYAQLMRGLADYIGGSRGAAAQVLVDIDVKILRGEHGLLMENA